MRIEDEKGEAFGRSPFFVHTFDGWMHVPVVANSGGVYRCMVTRRCCNAPKAAAGRCGQHMKSFVARTAESGSLAVRIGWKPVGGATITGRLRRLRIRLSCPLSTGLKTDQKAKEHGF